MTHDTWALYYGTGDRFHSSEGKWEEAPAWDIMGVVVPSASAGAQVLYAGDYYFRKDDGCCYSTDRMGLLDWLMNEFGFVLEVQPGPTTIYRIANNTWVDWTGMILRLVESGLLKIGRAKTYEEWNRLLNHMIEHKSALLMGEPRPIGKIG